VIEYELLLGAWLLSGRFRMAAWILAVATFTTFAGVSFYQGWIGEASCGCFGRLPITVSPWVALGIDSGVLLLLLVAFPSVATSGRGTGDSSQRPLVTVAKGLGVLAIVIAGIGIAFGEGGSGVRRLLQVVFGLSIAFTASSFFLALFGFSGGSAF